MFDEKYGFYNKNRFQLHLKVELLTSELFMVNVDYAAGESFFLLFSASLLCFHFFEHAMTIDLRWIEELGMT